MDKVRRLVINRDGYIVDLESGEVVDDQPLCYDVSCELPPIRDRDEWEHRLRAAVYKRPEVRVVSFKLPRWLLERVDKEVERRGLNSRSELIRNALMSYLSGQDGILAMVKRLRNLYAARGFMYAARSLLAFARVYLEDKRLQEDVARVEEELEAAIKHMEEEMNRLHRMLGMW